MKCFRLPKLSNESINYTSTLTNQNAKLLETVCCFYIYLMCFLWCNKFLFIHSITRKYNLINNILIFYNCEASFPIFLRFCINFYTSKFLGICLHPPQPELRHHCFYTIKKIPKLRQQSQKFRFVSVYASFFFMLLFTQYTVKLRALPLSAVAVLLHYLPNMSAFNSHMRQNAVA